MFSLPSVWRQRLAPAMQVSGLIVKMVVPLYVLADVLIYLDWIHYLSAPLTVMMHHLNLPTEAALPIAAGIFLNLYAAIALAVPLGLTSYEWTILGVFLGVIHSMPIETAIMRQLGVSIWYSITLRFAMAWVAVAPVLIMSSSFDHSAHEAAAMPVFMTLEQHSTWWQMLSHSLTNALILAAEITLLIVGLMVLIHGIKSIPWVALHLHKVGVGVSMLAGQLLGITYGAGVLIHEARTGHMSREQIFYVATFLMVCHSVIEDGLLFAMFGADYWVMMMDRLIFAFLAAGGLLWIGKRTGWLSHWLHGPVVEKEATREPV